MTTLYELRKLRTNTLQLYNHDITFVCDIGHWVKDCSTLADTFSR